MHRDQIDTIARRAELRSCPDATSLQRVVNISLKRIEANVSRVLFFGKPPTSAGRVLQIRLEQLHASTSGAVQVDLIV